jgi:hypothetical protein
MKKVKYILFALISTTVLFTIQSCDVTDIADVALQLTINFDPVFDDRAVPDSSVEVVNLEDYLEYNDNRDQIEDAEILHFNYSINEIKTSDNLPIDSIEFDRIAFYLIPTFTDGGARIPGQRYLLGEFTDVKISEYYKTAQHIIEVGDDVGELISEQIKETPYFIFVTEYSALKGDNRANYFDYIDAHVDMVVRVKTSE